MTPLQTILVTAGELRDLHELGRRGYIGLAPERVARILAALELGATACERVEQLQVVIARLRAQRP